jgi:TonB family protein
MMQTTAFRVIGSGKKMPRIAATALVVAVHSLVQAAPTEDELKAQQARASKCAQSYPLEAQRSGVTGKTKVRISVDSEGNAVDVVVINSSGSSREHRQLDRAALAFFRCMSPYKKEGKPREFESEYVWRLE